MTVNMTSDYLTFHKGQQKLQKRKNTIYQ